MDYCWTRIFVLQLSSQLEAEQDMLKLEKARVAEMEEQLDHMSQQVR